MPFYDHFCSSCNQEFEEFYSVTKDPPTVCSLCGSEGTVKRLISDVVMGTVKLEGRELKEHITKEREKIRHQVKKDENLRANIVGESKYNEILNNNKKIRDA